MPIYPWKLLLDDDASSTVTPRRRSKHGPTTTILASPATLQLTRSRPPVGTTGPRARGVQRLLGDAAAHDRAERGRPGGARRELADALLQGMPHICALASRTATQLAARLSGSGRPGPVGSRLNGCRAHTLGAGKLSTSRSDQPAPQRAQPAAHALRTLPMPCGTAEAERAPGAVVGAPPLPDGRARLWAVPGGDGQPRVLRVAARRAAVHAGACRVVRGATTGSSGRV